MNSAVFPSLTTANGCSQSHTLFIRVSEFRTGEDWGPQKQRLQKSAEVMRIAGVPHSLFLHGVNPSEGIPFGAELLQAGGWGDTAEMLWILFYANICRFLSSAGFLLLLFVVVQIFPRAVFVGFQLFIVFVVFVQETSIGTPQFAILLTSVFYMVLFKLSNVSWKSFCSIISILFSGSIVLI